MSIQELLEVNPFTIVAELEPPKGPDATEFCDIAASLKGRAHALYVPEMKGAVMRMGSLGASALLKQQGIETIVNLNCRDRNRLALQADMLSAAALKLDNILLNRGDEVSSGDHIDAQQVHDLDVDALVACARKIERGVDLAGNDLQGTATFCLGSEVNIGLAGGALEVEMQNLEKKIRAGVQYFFTQPTYDPDSCRSFLEKAASYNVPVLPQVCVLNSVGMARFMTRHIEGVRIPDDVINRLAKAPDKQQESIAIAADTIIRLRDISRGALLTAVGNQERLVRVFEKL